MKCRRRDDGSRIRERQSPEGRRYGVEDALQLLPDATGSGAEMTLSLLLSFLLLEKLNLVSQALRSTSSPVWQLALRRIKGHSDSTIYHVWLAIIFPFL